MSSSHRKGVSHRGKLYKGPLRKNDGVIWLFPLLWFADTAFFFFKQIEGLWQLSTIMMVSIFQQ